MPVHSFLQLLEKNFFMKIDSYTCKSAYTVLSNAAPKSTYHKTHAGVTEPQHWSAGQVFVGCSVCIPIYEYYSGNRHDLQGSV